VEALKLKASRGDLHTTVAIGYVRGEGDRIEKDPDRRICEAIGAVFAKFDELRSVRQVLLWFRQEAVRLPSAVYAADSRTVSWKLPVYNTVLRILSNPVYAGAYAFGRTESRVRIEGGRKRVVRGHRRAREQWQVLITEHHDGYISWTAYEHNQRVIADNTNMKGEMARGAVRRGEALLAGLLRCGHCGRKLHVAYSGIEGKVPRYHCRGANINHGLSEKCISFGALRIDRAVSAEVLRLLKPSGLQAALHAIDRHASEGDAKRRQIELALEQSRFEAARARRQYDAVDPDNRLVAGELERRWNERLGVVAQLEAELMEIDARRDPCITPERRQTLLDLGADLPRAWEHPAADAAIRKRILRAVLEEIVVRVAESQLQLVVQWKGGDHTTLSVVKNRSGQHRWVTKGEVTELIKELARLLPDGGVAALLNRLGHRTVKSLTWTAGRVRSFRSDHDIDVHLEGEREARGELTLEQAASALRTSKMTVLRMISNGVLPARQVCRGAPWVIRKDDLEGAHDRMANLPRAGGALPENPDQISLNLQ
jgi:excisionase family DNA binding protein